MTTFWIDEIDNEPIVYLTDETGELVTYSYVVFPYPAPMTEDEALAGIKWVS
jgi:hypothetical protein